jgi:hypothetical protein
MISVLNSLLVQCLAAAYFHIAQVRGVIPLRSWSEVLLLFRVQCKPHQQSEQEKDQHNMPPFQLEAFLFVHHVAFSLRTVL